MCFMTFINTHSKIQQRVQIVNWIREQLDPEKSSDTSTFVN